MVTIYGRIYSRAPRILWAAEEMGLAYKHVPVDHKAGDTSQPEYLAINPNGKIPALVDGEIKLFESMAINFYLATKYGKDLLPRDETGQAYALQWSFWGMSEIEPKLIALLIELIRKTPAERSQGVIDAARADLNRMFAVLEDHLKGRDYLLEERFTIADLNLAAIIALYQFVGTELADLLKPFPKADAWLHQRCLSRPAFNKVMAMGSPPADLPHLQSAG